MGRIVEDVLELNEILEEERKRGRCIVFGNGCFDIIHVGHIRYLKDAKALGDILVIGLNDDRSFRALKGREPTFPAKERAEIVASILYVDYVTLFSERTAERLILFLKPHVHAKGTDYMEETVPEREAVLSYGGRIAIVGDRKDHSVTEIIRRIRGV
jgi:rfaE bifunctional protein nucleotidyltransferase chain/domain